MSVLALLPLVGAAALIVVKGHAAKMLALAVSLIAFVISVVLLVSYRPGAGMQFSEQVAWIKPLGVYYALGLDGIGITLVLLVTIVTPLVIIASWNDFDADGATRLGRRRVTGRAPPPKYDSRVFFALVLAVESCALFLFLATDVFLFYVFFEVILIPMYFLIGGFGGARRSYAAAKFLIFGLLGGFVMLASVIGLYVLSVQAGPASYLLSDLSQLDIATGTGRWLFLGFMFAFAIKAPLVPLHTWLPDAAEESSPGGATMMVGVMDKIGTFGMIRFCLGLFPEAQPVGHAGGAGAGDHLHPVRRHPGHRQPRPDAADRLHLDQPLRLHRAGHLRLHQPVDGRLDALHAQPRSVDGRAVPGRRLPDQAARLARRVRLRRGAEDGSGGSRACSCSPGCRRCRCRVCPASCRSSWCWPAPSAGTPRTPRSRPWPSCWPRSTSC